MSYQRWTIAILAATTLILLAWEAFCLATPGEDDTISGVIRLMNKQSGGLIALLAIALVLHWFFQSWLPASWR
jgi:hypothetical protein